MIYGPTALPAAAMPAHDFGEAVICHQRIGVSKRSRDNPTRKAERTQ